MRDYPPLRGKTRRSVGRRRVSSRQVPAVKLILTWLVLIVVALFFVQQRISYIRTEKRVESLLKEKQKLQTDILPYRLEEGYQTQFPKLEKLAREQLHLKEPGKYNVVIIDVEPDGTIH